MNQRPMTRWDHLKARLRDLARLPLIALVIFTASIMAWLGCWLVWRVGEFVFSKYLSRPWVS